MREAFPDEGVDLDVLQQLKRLGICLIFKQMWSRLNGIFFWDKSSFGCCLCLSSIRVRPLVWSLKHRGSASSLNSMRGKQGRKMRIGTHTHTQHGPARSSFLFFYLVFPGGNSSLNYCPWIPRVELRLAAYAHFSTLFSKSGIQAWSAPPMLQGSNQSPDT